MQAISQIRPGDCLPSFPAQGFQLTWSQEAQVLENYQPSAPHLSLLLLSVLIHLLVQVREWVCPHVVQVPGLCDVCLQRYATTILQFKFCTVRCGSPTFRLLVEVERSLGTLLCIHVLESQQVIDACDEQK